MIFSYLARVPAIAHWPGHIIPGQESGLASTLDILPTVVTSLGLEASLLENILLDGFDLSASLTSGGESARDHIVYIHQQALQEDGIHALRHRQFKAHFTTEGNIFSTNEDLECSQKKQVISYSFLTVLY